MKDEDLKIIIEDEEYEDFKPFLRGMQIHIKRNRITYDYFYRASDFYEEYLKEQKNEDKKIKRQFLKDLKIYDYTRCILLEKTNKEKQEVEGYFIPEGCILKDALEKRLKSIELDTKNSNVSTLNKENSVEDNIAAGIVAFPIGY